MIDYLTQDEVNELEPGTEIMVRWKNMRTPVLRKIEFHNGAPCVRETKPSGFPVLVPLRPVFEQVEAPKGVKVWFPESFY